MNCAVSRITALSLDNYLLGQLEELLVRLARWHGSRTRCTSGNRGIWCQLAQKHGRAVAGKPGGDQRSSKTDAHADLIIAMVEEQGDITLVEIQSGLSERGISVGIGTLWRFFDRHGITRKKRPATRSSRTARTY